MVFARYFYATLWTLLLAGFAYTELFVSGLLGVGVSFEEKIIELMNSRIMLFSSVGLVAMLFVDGVITKKITRNNQTQHSDFSVGVMLASIISVIFLAVVAEGIKENALNPPNWFRLCYVFLFFLGCLIVYKAGTLNIKHYSSNIIESKIVN